VADDPVRGFLGRWSRLKHAAAAEVEVPVAPVDAAPSPPEDGAAEETETPPLESLDFDSDYSSFLGSRVDAGLKRAALNKLFHTEHFNTMDGLDTYIEDFNVFEPLPQSMVAQLAHSRETLFPTLPEDWLKPAVSADGADAASAADLPPGLPDESAEPFAPPVDAPPAAASDAVLQAAPENGEPRSGKSRSESE
jgi:hypothetical protein